MKYFSYKSTYIHFLTTHILLIHVFFFPLDSKKPATKNRRTREAIENNDRATTKDKRVSSSQVTKR